MHGASLRWRLPSCARLRFCGCDWQSTSDLTATPLLVRYERVRAQVQNAVRSLDDFVAFMNERVAVEDSVAKALSKTTRHSACGVVHVFLVCRG
jgi:hypothetical protein